MVKDSVVLFVSVASVMLLGGVLLWSHFTSRPNVIAPELSRDQAIITTVLSDDVTGDPTDVYA